jgi:hypothetical protein
MFDDLETEEAKPTLKKIIINIIILSMENIFCTTLAVISCRYV